MKIGIALISPIHKEIKVQETDGASRTVVLNGFGGDSLGQDHEEPRTVSTMTVFISDPLQLHNIRSTHAICLVC